ncbi:Mth938-like domain-containing protein [Micromonospora sp. NBC_01699]|uniref:Mth938-like domain-containing protein n=1 Tax=Micromonospora sp. NBC_01699 TaxID=2975984 RepID=UPI002E34A282|nr:Mth938-like domain-containing protein [Micromonospora sp. NBC_01699]
MTERKSPLVTAISWGEIKVEGLGTVKDAKLYPGGGRAWDWSETGTGHSPGIQPADVAEIVDNGATVVVLGVGMEQRLGVMVETLDLLRSRGVAVHVRESSEAVRMYNELAASVAVGALLHSTC